MDIITTILTIYAVVLFATCVSYYNDAKHYKQVYELMDKMNWKLDGDLLFGTDPKNPYNTIICFTKSYSVLNGYTGFVWVFFIYCSPYHIRWRNRFKKKIQKIHNELKYVHNR